MYVHVYVYTCISVKGISTLLRGFFIFSKLLKTVHVMCACMWACMCVRTCVRMRVNVCVLVHHVKGIATLLRGFLIFSRFLVILSHKMK